MSTSSFLIRESSRSSGPSKTSSFTLYSWDMGRRDYASVPALAKRPVRLRLTYARWTASHAAGCRYPIPSVLSFISAERTHPALSTAPPCGASRRKRGSVEGFVEDRLGAVKVLLSGSLDVIGRSTEFPFGSHSAPFRRDESQHPQRDQFQPHL